MCIITTIAKYPCVCGKNICIPLLCSMFPYIHTYIPLWMCFMIIFLNICICYFYYPNLYTGTSMCYLKKIQRLMPETNTQMTYIHGIYVLLITILVSYKSLWTEFLKTHTRQTICFLLPLSSRVGVPSLLTHVNLYLTAQDQLRY